MSKKNNDKVEYIATYWSNEDGNCFEYLTESDLQKKLFCNSLNGWRIFKVSEEYTVHGVLSKLN